MPFFCLFAEHLHVIMPLLSRKALHQQQQPKDKPERQKLDNWAKVMQLFTGCLFLQFIYRTEEIKKKYLQHKIIHSLGAWRY